MLAAIRYKEQIMEGVNQAGLVSTCSLIVSATPLMLGIAFALSPNERWLALMRPLSLAGIFAAVSNTCLGLATALPALAAVNTSDPQVIRLAAVQLSKVAVLPSAAFACLAIAWLSIAIGMRKQP
jgi:hypothetical protein